MYPFNTYTVGFELGSLKDYCIHHGKQKKLSRSDFFETEGIPTHCIGYITNGCFKYIAHNEAEGKDYISGFAFCGEFVADFPNCMKRQPAVVSIVAMGYSEVYIINGKNLLDIIDDQAIDHIYERLFKLKYSQYLDTYRMTTRERYKRFLLLCPEIVQSINLKRYSFLSESYTHDYQQHTKRDNFWTVNSQNVLRVCGHDGSFTFYCA